MQISIVCWWVLSIAGSLLSWNNRVVLGQLSSDALTTFYTSSYLPLSTYAQIIGYNSRTDTIWMLGGSTCGTCVYSFDVSSSSLDTAHAPLTSSVQNANGGIMIGDVLYYYSPQEYALCTYNTNNETETCPFSQSPYDMEYPCVTANVLNDGQDANEIYVIGDSTTKALLIYHIDGGYWITSQQTNSKQYTPICHIGENNYLYVKGSGSSYVEKININTLSSFTQITTFSISSYIGAMVSARINNLIYMIGGSYYYNGWTKSIKSDVYCLNTDNDEIVLVDTATLSIAGTTGIVTNDNVLYVIGGAYSYPSSWTAVDSITNTNQLAPVPVDNSTDSSGTSTSNSGSSSSSSSSSGSSSSSSSSSGGTIVSASSGNDIKAQLKTSLNFYVFVFVVYLFALFCQ